jgi:hypothetical protein
MDTQVRTAIEVLSPLGVRSQVDHERSAGLPTLSGRVAALLDNHKSNAANFLSQVARNLTEDHGVKEIITASKGSAAKPADPSLLERFRKVDFAITAFAD